MMLTRVLLAALLCSVSISHAQHRAEDRRAFLSPQMQVSDDPRRVPVKPGPRGPEGTLVLRGGRVFDAIGTSVRNASVVIERNRILAILPEDSSQWPADARVIDVSNKTVMPGMIDLHSHLSLSETDDFVEANSDAASMLIALERSRYFIASGITSVRDVTGRNDVPFRLKQWVASNRVPGPRVFPAGEGITGKGGHGAEGPSDHLNRMNGIRVASGPDEWRQAVREQFHKGADVIKLLSHFSAEEVRAAVDEAHALGLKVTVDAETFYIDLAIEAGADTIEHPLPRSDKTIELMAKRGVAADPTLIPYIILFDQTGGYFGSTSRRFTFSHASSLEMLRRLRRAGVKCGVGTDLIRNWYRYLPTAYVTELKQLVAAGWSVPEALTAATRINAEILDMADKLGTLQAGKLADLIVVDGRPDENLDDLEKVELVIRDGYVIVEDGQVLTPQPAPMRNWKPAATGAGGHQH